MMMMLTHLFRKPSLFWSASQESILDQQGQCALVRRVCDSSGRFKVVYIFLDFRD